MDTVRETKRADELQPGDWIAAGPYNDGTDDAEVLFVYRRSANAVSVTIQEVSIALPDLIDLHADAEITVLTAEEIAGHKGAAERARKIADIRAFADRLEANPEIPMAYGIGGQADVSESTTYSAAEIRAVKAFAEKHGGEFRKSKDHASARVRFGDVTYSLISWHKDGRPAEPAPEPHPSWPTEAELKPWETLAPATERVAESMEPAVCLGRDMDCGRPLPCPDHPADPIGLAYTRADDEPDDPTPVTGARVDPHVGGMTDEGLVDETPPTHYSYYADVTECGIPIADMPHGHNATNAGGAVTCQACLDAMPQAE
jgi:hypothetical protein